MDDIILSSPLANGSLLRVIGVEVWIVLNDPANITTIVLRMPWP
jgi:hypothetical protein